MDEKKNIYIYNADTNIDFNSQEKAHNRKIDSDNNSIKWMVLVLLLILLAIIIIIIIIINVTYWPSTEPSIKKQVHSIEDIGISPWPMDGLNLVQMRTPTGNRWESNNYITRCHRRLESSWSSRQAELSWSCSHSSSSSRSWGQDAGWAAQQNEEEVLNTEELGVNMWQSLSVSNSPLTHNQHQPFRNPFKNKVWEVYFSKEVCSFVITVNYVSVYSYICIM